MALDRRDFVQALRQPACDVCASNWREGGPLNPVTALYLRLLNALHLPFVQRGENDPYHLLFRNFVEQVQAMPSPMPPPVRAGFIRTIEDEEEEGKRN